MIRRLRGSLAGKAARLLLLVTIQCNFVVTGVARAQAAPRGGVVRASLRNLGAMCGELRTIGAQPVSRLVGSDREIVFIGSQSSRTELEHIFFEPGEARVEALPAVGAFGIAKATRRWLEDGADLVVREHWTETFRSRSTSGYRFTTPSIVDQVIALPETPEELLAGKNNWKKRKRINESLKEGYGRETGAEASDLRAFHDELYAPYSKARFGERAVLTSYYQLERRFEHGQIVFIAKDGRRVAGKLCYLDGDTYNNDDLGFHAEAEGFRQHAGAILLDWFGINAGYEKGAKKVSLGGTRSWVSDGVFVYKSRWKARPEKRQAIHPEWSFYWNELPDDLRERVNRIGFVLRIDEGHYALRLGESEAGGVSLEQATALGLDGVAILEPAGERVRLLKAEETGDA